MTKLTDLPSGEKQAVAGEKGIVLPTIDRSISLAELGDFSDRLAKMMEELRDEILAPKPRKTPPEFTASQVGALCRLDRGQVNYLATKEGSTLPPGTVSGAGRSRRFTLAEARQWVQALGGLYVRPADVMGEVVLLANFKGGSTKTSTTMSLAQGLTLRGRKVLVVDLDPQGSLSELCGLYAEKDVTENDTVLPYIYGEQASLHYAIQDTYWDGLSVIASNRFLSDAEFSIAGALSTDGSFPFWDVLNQGLTELRKDYDYILIDTAPALSFVTLNAIMAANALLMPIVPESLDFISSVQFWRLLSDLSRSFMKVDDLTHKKRFDFIHILHSKVDTSSTSNAPVVKDWIAKAYGDWVLDIDIPFSNLVGSEALEFSTVYDIDTWTGGMKTLQRIKDPFDRLAQYVDDTFAAKWRKQA